ncbi:hypothetical protein PQR14_34160 [Paraburkholderia bryophila]|uniref:hypothetical protein n=1 Tax=Paraburkholderia bryophila TaxID=420952 RepID=UPI0038B707D1
MLETGTRKARRMGGLFEVCFGGGVEILGVIRGMKVETSEGAFPVIAARNGDEVCVIAGPLALSICSDTDPSDSPWMYLGHGDVGLNATGIRRFSSVGVLREWVAEVRSTEFHPVVARVVVL